MAGIFFNGEGTETIIQTGVEQATQAGAETAGNIAGESITFLLNDPAILGIGIVLIIATILIIVFIKKIIINSILGFVVWIIITQVMGIELPLIPSLILSVLFGLAGVGAVLVLAFLGILPV